MYKRQVSIIESLLFAAAKPLRVQDLRKVLAETSKQQIQLALKHLMAITVERGVVLAQVAGGFQYRTHPDNAVWVQKMLQARPARLSRTQIETLAIVAYRQPITRPEIDDVRGVDSGAVLKTLLERDLIQIVGRKEEPGRPLLYGTTVRFLEFFNLRSLRDLPTLRDFRDLSEESKATLRARLGQTEAEALGQGVLGLAGGDEASADDVDEPAADEPDEVAVKDEAATDELVDAGTDEVAVIEDEAATEGSSSADEPPDEVAVIEDEAAADELVDAGSDEPVSLEVTPGEDHAAAADDADAAGGPVDAVGEASDADASTPTGAPDHGDDRSEEA